jgi:hypothetical protein
MPARVTGPMMPSTVPEKHPTVVRSVCSVLICVGPSNAFFCFATFTDDVVLVLALVVLVLVLVLLAFDELPDEPHAATNTTKPASASPLTIRRPATGCLL